MPVANQGKCATARCTSSQDCSCPIGTVLTFNGTCQPLNSSIDGTHDNICGPDSRFNIPKGMSYYACRCGGRSPYALGVVETDVSYHYGCSSDCARGAPAAVDALGNALCPISGAGSGTCYAEGGYALINGHCTRCADETPFVGTSGDACVAECGEGEVRSGPNSALCIAIETCTSQIGADGFHRLLSFDKRYCVDTAECTEGHGGVALNRTCVCGARGELPYLDAPEGMHCVEGASFPLRTTSYILKCPGDYYMAFDGSCAPCPESGCYIAEAGARAESVNAVSFCGDNTAFAYNASGNYYVCECIQREGNTYKVAPSRVGCIASCDETTMVAGSVLVLNDACDCATTYPAYVPGESVCLSACETAFRSITYQQASSAKVAHSANVCQRVCRGEDCSCEDGYVIGLGGECVPTGSCGGNTTEKGDRCGCATGYVVSFDETRCIARDECVSVDFVLSADKTRCISDVDCGSAISLTGATCVKQQLYAEPACGDNAVSRDGKCVCAEGFTWKIYDDSGCKKEDECGVEDARRVDGDTKICFINGAACTGNGCGCANGYVLGINGRCVKK